MCCVFGTVNGSMPFADQTHLFQLLNICYSIWRYHCPAPFPTLYGEKGYFHLFPLTAGKLYYGGLAILQNLAMQGCRNEDGLDSTKSVKKYKATGRTPMENGAP